MAKEFFSVCIPLNGECLQEDGICVKKELCLKEEIEWETQDVTAHSELYADHKVKEELVLGPETVQMPDVAFGTCSISEKSNKEELDLCKGTWHKEKISKLRSWIVKECDLIENVVHNCDLCQKSFRDNFGLTTHMKTHEASDINSKFILKKPKTAKIKVDKSSLNKFSDHSIEAKLMQHDVKQEKKITNKINFNSQLTSHTKDVNEKKYIRPELKIEKHSGKENHAAKSMNKSDSNIDKNLYAKEKTNSHQKIEIPSTTCEICKKIFSCKFHLIRHERLHTGQKPYKCKICNRQFAQKDYLLRHEKIHLKQKQYSCEYCYKQFSDHSNYNKHKRFHREDKRYTCEVCGKQFSQTIHLSSHQLTHTGHKPYSCGTCQKQFTYKHRLVAHERIHSGQKPFGCQLCMKRFVAQCRLSRHGILIHKLRLSFMCDVCQIQFKTKPEIIKHMSDLH